MSEYYEKLRQQGYYLIAEIGVNYYEIAEKEDIAPLDAAVMMMEKAHEAGADAVKFQTYKAEHLVMVDSPGSWSREDIPIETQYELFKLYDHFGESEYQTIAGEAKRIGIEFMSTPFDNESVDYLEPYLNVYKISSSDITNYPLMEQIAKKNKPIILSTGASEYEEIVRAVEFIKKYNDKQLTLLHCVLEYPTPYAHANLCKIPLLKQAFPDAVIGYSDHTKPDDNMGVLTTAYTLGAQVIEKHFTLDKTIKRANDHFHSMDCDDLKKTVERIKFIQEIRGNSDLHCLESELVTRDSVRRSAVSRCQIKKGEILTEDMIVFKRPGTGLGPTEVQNLIGKPARTEITGDSIIKREYFM